jgi:hypothetical protein
MQSTFSMLPERERPPMGQVSIIPPRDENWTDRELAAIEGATQNNRLTVRVDDVSFSRAPWAVFSCGSHAAARLHLARVRRQYVVAIEGLGVCLRTHDIDRALDRVVNALNACTPPRAYTPRYRG